MGRTYVMTVGDLIANLLRQMKARHINDNCAWCNSYGEAQIECPNVQHAKEHDLYGHCNQIIQNIQFSHNSHDI